jgi:hypothetical protein
MDKTGTGKRSFARVGTHVTKLERALDSGDQLVRSNGLGQEIVGARQARAIERVDVAKRGKKKNGCVRPSRQGAAPVANFEPFKPGMLTSR